MFNAPVHCQFVIRGETQVDREISRRDLLRWSVLGGATIPLASLLAACGGGSDGRAGRPSSTTAAAANAKTAAYDPAKKWWLQQNFAPVTKEVEAFDLKVTAGAIPPALAGLYVRNGSNPQSGDSTHWFFGDGMVHGIRLEDGKAKWYRNRYVGTDAVRQRRRGSAAVARRAARPTSPTSPRSGTAASSSRAARSGSRTRSRPRT